MSKPAAGVLVPLAFDLVYDDGVPFETEWHSFESPLLRELIYQAMVESGRTDFFVGAHILSTTPWSRRGTSRRRKGKDYRSGPSADRTSSA